jgi:uncharacterized protein (UPF0147 family)
MSQNEIEQIELSINEARKMVERGRMAEELSMNSAFKKLVLDGYFVEEAARLVHLSSDPNLPENIRNVVTRDMAGPGAFKRYLSALVQMGHMAAQEISDAQHTLDEIRQDELNEMED